MIAEFLVQRLDDVETAGEGIYFNVAEATGVGILLTLNFLGPIAILSPSITASKLGMSREDASRRLAELIKKVMCGSLRRVNTVLVRLELNFLLGSARLNRVVL